ncbi:MAG TPA: single-stranded DNA-binding protein [Bacteroidales bacterium]|nr:single-stranded DNA-binding protein [Bacteroidales bacterium]
MKKNNEKKMVELNEELENIEVMQETADKNENSGHREMNVVELCGYVGFDPEVQDFASGKKKIRFKLATHRTLRTDGEGEGQKVTNWFPVVVWNKTADEALTWLRKGNKVKIKGYLNYRTWEDKDGNKRNLYETVATELSAIPA